MRFSASTAAALVASIPAVLAQTSTTCDPTKQSCPDDTGLNAATFSSDFTSSKGAASWSLSPGTTLSYSDQGAEFDIKQAGGAPTIESDFYIFGGRVDVEMTAAPGAGIVSSIVLESDDLDEIDFEFIGSNITSAQSNFYGKGNVTVYDRGAFHTVSSDITKDYHTYSIDWNKDRIEWIIDGETVRTQVFSDPLSVFGANYPQTPMRVKLGSWDGGDSASEGTSTWAGGKPSFSEGPFKMFVKSVKITNANPACSYSYSDHSGSWDSINAKTTGCTLAGKVSTDNSTSASASASGSVVAAPTSSHSVEAASQTQVAATSIVQGNAATSAVQGGAATSPTPNGFIPVIQSGAFIPIVQGGAAPSGFQSVSSSKTKTCGCKSKATGGASPLYGNSTTLAGSGSAQPSIGVQPQPSAGGAAPSHSSAAAGGSPSHSSAAAGGPPAASTPTSPASGSSSGNGNAGSNSMPASNSGSGSSSGSGSGASSSGGAHSSSTVVPSHSGASTMQVMFGGSLLSIVVAFAML